MCNLWKDLTDFHINTVSGNGKAPKRYYRPRCKTCYALKRLAWKSNRGNRGTARKAVDRSYVYFIQCGVYVKIGKANDVEQRRQDGKTFNPFPLEILGTIECGSENESYKLENSLHRLFKPWHHEGEWFIIGPQILDFINTATIQ